MTHARNTIFHVNTVTRVIHSHKRNDGTIHNPAPKRDLLEEEREISRIIHVILVTSRLRV